MKWKKVQVKTKKHGRIKSRRTHDKIVASLSRAVDVETIETRKRDWEAFGICIFTVIKGDKTGNHEGKITDNQTA